MNNVTSTNNKDVITIIKLFDGRYCFRTIPQEHRMIYLDFVCAESDEEAIKRAKKVNPNFDYKIINQDLS